jgi:hypothetical protein
VYEILAPGGALALIVHTVEGRPVPPAPDPPPIPHAEIKALVEKYLGTTKRAGQGTAPVRTTRRFDDVLVRTRFGMPQVIFVPGIPRPRPHQRERALRLLLDVLLGAAPVLRPCRGLATEMRELLRSPVARGNLLGLARRYRTRPRA